MRFSLTLNLVRDVSDESSGGRVPVTLLVPISSTESPVSDDNAAGTVPASIFWFRMMLVITPFAQVTP